MAGYLGAIAVSIIWLYVVNNLFVDAIPPLAPYVINTYPKFVVDVVNFLAGIHATLFSAKFVDCLWAINLSLTLSIIGNLVLLLHRPRWFLHLVKGLLLGIAILPIYVVFKIFPFNLAAASSESLIRLILIVFAGGLAAGFVVEMVRFVLALLDHLRKREKGDGVLHNLPPSP